MMNKAKRICFVSPFAENVLYNGRKAGGGGAERQLTLIGQGLADLGWEVHYLVGNLEIQFNSIDSRFHIWQIPFRYLSGSKLCFIPDTIRLLRTLRKINAPIVGNRGSGPLVFMGIILGRAFFKYKTVVWIQADHDIKKNAYYPNENNFIKKTPKKIYSFLLKKADLLISQTDGQKEVIKDSLKRTSSVIPNIADSPWPKNSFALPGSIKPGYVLWAGNPTPNKRAEMVMEIARQLHDYSFVMAMNPGNAKRENGFGNGINKLPNVTFLGSVPPVEMESWFDRAALLLNTSVAEGFPNTFLQAWQRGIPVLTAGVDPGGIIKKYGLGDVVNMPMSGDSQELENLKEKFLLLMEDKELRSVVETRAKRYVAENHDKQVIIKKIDTQLTQLLSI